MEATTLIDSFRVDGKVAVVTGAGSGIGRASALALAGAGADGGLRRHPRRHRAGHGRRDHRRWRGGRGRRPRRVGQGRRSTLWPSGWPPNGAASTSGATSPASCSGVRFWTSPRRISTGSWPSTSRGSSSAARPPVAIMVEPARRGKHHQHLVGRRRCSQPQHRELRHLQGRGGPDDQDVGRRDREEARPGQCRGSRIRDHRHDHRLLRSGRAGRPGRSHAQGRARCARWASPRTSPPPSSTWPRTPPAS